LIQFCQGCPSNAALVTNSRFWRLKDPIGNTEAIGKLLSSKSHAARRLPLLLAEILLLSRLRDAEEWVANLLEKLSKQNAVAADFRRRCLPLIIMLLESSSNFVQVRIYAFPPYNIQILSCLKNT